MKLIDKLINIDRKKYTLIIFMFIFLLLSIRLYVIQVYPFKIVQGEIKNYQSEKISLMKYNILDINGKDMINYNKKYILVLDTKPFSLNNYEETIEDLMALNFIMKSENIEFSYSDIMSKDGKNYFEISEETYNKINTLKEIKGIYTYIYDIPNKKEAWTIENSLLDISEKNIIQGSIQEKLYNNIKDNKYPMLSFYLDDKAVYSIKKLQLREENKNIQLTINKDLQQDIREILLNEKYQHLKNIGVVLMESKTGKIEAMVQKDESQANINLGIGNSGYEPGSIFKVITEAAALEEGVIQSKSGFSCDGSVCIRNNKKHPHGMLSVYDAFNLSCNDIFGKVGSLVGYKKMMEYSEELGLFSRVINYRGEGIDEALGIKPKESDGMTNISIGQCLTATPIQMIGAINAVVNDGIYVKPYILQTIIDNNNNAIEIHTVEEKKIFSETTSKIVMENMRSAVKYGTGIEAYVPGIELGGKTGSSTGGSNTTHGWFAGYCKINEKKYTILVLVPNLQEKGPNGEILGGGNTAGVVFSDIVKILKNK